MSEKSKSIQDGFVLPSEGQVADRPHRAYDVEVDQETYEWLKQTPFSSRVPFVPLGHIPKQATGYLTRGDGPKAVAAVQDDTRARLPRAIGIPKGTKLRSSPSDKDVDRTFEAETLSRREAIAQRVVDFVCGKLLELQGDDLNNFINNGLQLTVPKDLIPDVGRDATFVPRLTKGMANGWIPNSQDAGANRRESWLSSFSEYVYTRVKLFIADRLQIQKGELVTDTKGYDHPYSRMNYTRGFPSAVLDKLCRVECDCADSGSFIVSISFSPRNLDHAVTSYQPLFGSHHGGSSVWTETKWSVPPSGIAWKTPLEKAA